MNWTSFVIGLGFGLGIGVIAVWIAIRHTTLSMTVSVLNSTRRNK